MREVTRRQAVQGAGIGAAGLLAGCIGDGDGNGNGNGDDSTGNGTTETPNTSEVHVLTDYTDENTWEPYWNEELIPGWESQSEIPIEVEFTGFQGTSEQRLATLMQAGDPPEAFHCTLSEVGDLVNQGLTVSVEDALSDLEEEWGDALYRFTMEPYISPDRQDEAHLVPHGLYVGGTLNYRSDIYADLGLEEPETWSELVDNARAIHEAGGEYEDVFGWALPAQPSGKSGSDFTNWLYNSGGNTFRWSDGPNSEPELWFDEEHVIPVLEHLQELQQYSPDPSGVGWGPTIIQWAQGRIGQCFMNNAWLCGTPLAAGQGGLARATEQTLIPTREGVSDPPARGWVLADGAAIIRGSDNPAGGKEFLKYMYGPERHIEVTLMEPMRFLPPYESIMESDAYQNADIFQGELGQAMLEKNQHVMENITPEMYGEGDIASSPETSHAGSFDITSQLTNRVVVDGQDPQAAYDWAYSQYERRYEQAKQMADY